MFARFKDLLADLGITRRVIRWSGIIVAALTLFFGTMAAPSVFTGEMEASSSALLAVAAVAVTYLFFAFAFSLYATLLLLFVYGPVMQGWAKLKEAPAALRAMRDSLVAGWQAFAGFFRALPGRIAAVTGKQWRAAGFTVLGFACYGALMFVMWPVTKGVTQYMPSFFGDDVFHILMADAVLASLTLAGLMIVFALVIAIIKAIFRRNREDR